jgi:hypothetical protein
MNRSKWALVFASEQDLNQFILEVDSSQDKQFRLSIEEYTVFCLLVTGRSSPT